MVEIRELKKTDLEELKRLTDQLIGQGYYQLTELEDVLKRSQTAGFNFSYVLVVDNKIKGFRFTYPPGKWDSGRGKGLSEYKWPYPKLQTAYFQSLFVDPQYTGQGYGKRMSQSSIDQLKNFGARGVVCHSWVESPNDSSRRYLKSLDLSQSRNIKSIGKTWTITVFAGEDLVCVRLKKCIST